jgi:RNA polymerase sigma factor (TIGR02999 family)
MNDVPRHLSDVEHGDAQPAGDLLPLVYAELRRLAKQRLAQEKLVQTLQATALVHEAYLRLVDGETIQRWESRGHFYAAAAEAMRRILGDRARDKGRLKRGGGRRRHYLNLDELLNDKAPPDDLHAAQALGIARRTAVRDCAFARAWLFE